MHDDTLFGLEDSRHGRLPRPSRSLSSGGAIFHLHARTGSRSKGQSARAAAAYIQRAGEYRRDQGNELLYTESGHMPAWAAADPTSYWDAADLYERANGRLFKRVEVALPLALSAAEQQALAVGFAHHLTDEERLPYTLALHAGNDPNPRAHQQGTMRVGAVHGDLDRAVLLGRVAQCSVSVKQVHFGLPRANLPSNSQTFAGRLETIHHE